MPAPKGAQMAELAKQRFRSFGITVPVGWRQPQGRAAELFARAFQASEREAAPDPSALFRAASSNGLHVATQREQSRDLTEYLDATCEAICFAWSTWQAAASMGGVVVNGPTGAGGQVTGPPWTPLIMQRAPKRSEIMIRYSQAVATAIGTGWATYEASLKLPGLPLWPAFAAWMLPVAPPTPSLPQPLSALTQVTAPLMRDALKAQMVAAFNYPNAAFATETFDAIADAFEKTFVTWQATTTVTNVLGGGPVPSFAPPLVMSGPVVGGMASMPPGGLT